MEPALGVDLGAPGRSLAQRLQFLEPLCDVAHDCTHAGDCPVLVAERQD